jgi:hypothetical protein
MKYKGIILIVLLLPLLAACAQMGGENVVGFARTINVFETNGNDATVRRGAVQAEPRAGFRLADNDLAITGDASNIYLLLNTESIMKIDEQSLVEINHISGQNLTLTLLEGAIVADIKRENDNDIYEIYVGNVLMGVRGTSFIVEYRSGKNPVIVMLEGSASIGDAVLEAGEIAIIDEAAKITVEPLVIENITSPFITGEIARREAMATVYGAGIRIAVTQAGAAHNEAAVIMEFELMELYLYAGLHDNIHWPFDGDYELRLYTDGRISAGTLGDYLPFTVYENDWRCLRPGCLAGWVWVWFDGTFEQGEWIQCECVDEMERVMRDWR